MSATTHPTPEQLQILLNGPALAPPPGVIPNFIDPPNLDRTGTVVQLITLIVSTLAIIMRIYTKARILHQIAGADYAIILGWAVFVGYAVPGFLAKGVAPGVKQWNVQLKDLGSFLYARYVHVGSVMYGFCIFFVKLSILLQYLQIFVPRKTRNMMYLASHALIWTNLIFYLISTFLEIFACKPIAKAWNPLITTGHCINVLALNVAASSINSLSDLAILILPQVSIWRLQMSLKRKIQISAIFSIGIFACVCSIIRLSFAIRLYGTTDITYYAWLTGLWTYPEMASGILVACLPVSPKFFQALNETGAFSKVRTSLKSLLTFTIVSSQKSADNNTAEDQISSNGPMFRHAKYKSLPDGRPLADNSRETSTDTITGEDKHHGHETYIMRTIDIAASSEPNVRNLSSSTNGPAKVWQGESTFGTSAFR